MIDWFYLVFNTTLIISWQTNFLVEHLHVRGLISQPTHDTYVVATNIYFLQDKTSKVTKHWFHRYIFFLEGIKVHGRQFDQTYLIIKWFSVLFFRYSYFNSSDVNGQSIDIDLHSDHVSLLEIFSFYCKFQDTRPHCSIFSHVGHFGWPGSSDTF